ncbi:DNA-binding response regulator, partial [Micromonospora aurantiaca]|nr:DNA-binding response regulator [Micromonospora aurantiaca]
MESDTRGAEPARILVVDDEPAVRESLTSSLEFEGYRVEDAA